MAAFINVPPHYVEASLFVQTSEEAVEGAELCDATIAVGRSCRAGREVLELYALRETMF